MQKTITVDIIEHAKTGLLVATSDEMRGLLVHGRTIEELEERLPIAIKDIVEHNNGSKGRVTVSPVRRAVADTFVSKRRTFELAAAA